LGRFLPSLSGNQILRILDFARLLHPLDFLGLTLYEFAHYVDARQFGARHLQVISGQTLSGGPIPKQVDFGFNKSPIRQRDFEPYIYVLNSYDGPRLLKSPDVQQCLLPD
jgi:hypothetical protein